MDKLKLSLEELAVTTFDATSPASAADFAPTRNTGCETCGPVCLP